MDLDYILKCLLSEQNKYKGLSIPQDIESKRRLMRSLLNVRPPLPINDEFLKAQNTELQKQLNEKVIVEIKNTSICATNNKLRLWQGDITKLKADAIVNAANDRMLGCFIPLHGCIDNAIHSAAGVQLRQECHKIMLEQGHVEPIGSAQITKAYNLPAQYVIHTVGPVIDKEVTQKDEVALAECYYSCLLLADNNKLESIAFCCISTGEFKFPNQRAAEIAVTSVTDYLQKHSDTHIKFVIFNVFKDCDFSIYTQLLQQS